jgi:tetratricopeptide (TPR) repeat protein
MARTSSFSYKGKNAPISQIAQELRVGTVIEGSVQRAGNKLRIVAQLINTADSSHVWSETFDRELTTTDIFAVQDEIALKIAGRLAPNASVAAEAMPTANLEAYDLYLRGRDMFVTNYDSAPKAIMLFSRATQLDRAFALGWAWEGLTRARIYLNGGADAEAEAELANRDIDEALQLQPDQPQAHLARAIIFSAEANKLDEFAREIDLAEGGRPPTAETLLTRGGWLRDRGRVEESSLAYLRSMELDPRNTAAVNSYGLSLMFLHRYPEAIEAFDRAVAMGGSIVSASNKINALLTWEGDGTEAMRIFNSIPDERWSILTRGFLSFYLQAIGNHAAALAQLQRIEPPEFLSQWDYFIRAAHLARVHEGMGEVEQALGEYREALPIAEAFRAKHPESYRVYVTLACIYTGLGQKEAALAAARKCVALVPPEKNPYVASRTGHRVLANALARFDQMDEALAIVREDIEKGWWRRNMLLLQPDFSALQKDPRFRAIAEKAPL